MRKALKAAFYFLLLTPVASCHKDPFTKPVVEQPAPSKATLKRTYLVSGVVKHDTTYSLLDSVRAVAQVRDGRLIVDVYSKQTVPGYSDGIVFSIDKSRLQPGITGNYNLTPDGAAAYFNTVYVIRYLFPNKEAELRSAVTEFGHNVSGSLHITAYNSTTRQMSGSFILRINGLAHVPGWPYQVLTNAPADVQIEGSFDDVKAPL